MALLRFMRGGDLVKLGIEMFCYHHCVFIRFGKHGAFFSLLGIALVVNPSHTCLVQYSKVRSSSAAEKLGGNRRYDVNFAKQYNPSGLES